MQKNHKRTLMQFLKMHMWQLSVLSIVFFLTTLPFATRYPFNWDASQFILGVENYSVEMHQPHPPGYPLLIAVAKVLSLGVEAHTALLMESMAFALVAVIGMYVLIFRIWGKRWLALVTSLAWLLNPALWLYRETGLTYTIDSAATVMLLLWTERIFKGHHPQRYAIYSAIGLAVFGGFRPSMIALLAPVLLFQWIYIRSWKTVAWSALAAFLTCLPWYIPMVLDSGGLAAYREMSQALYLESASANSVLYGAPLSNTLQQLQFTIITVLVSWNSMLLLMIAGVLISIYCRLRGTRVVDWRYVWLSAAVLIMPITVFGVLHIGQLGYVLIMLPVGYLLCAYVFLEISRLRYRALRWPIAGIVGALIFLHASVFLFLSPAYTHPEFVPKRRIELWFQHTARQAPQLFKLNAALLQQNDDRAEQLVAVISQYRPEEVLVITGRNISYPASNGLPIRNDELFRELSAILPEYTIIQVASDADTYLWAQEYIMETHKEPKLALPQTVKYIIIALDQIPKEGMPKGITLEHKALVGSQYYYVGSMKQPFTFYNIAIKHRSKP